MRKIIDFVIGQLLIIFVMLCVCGFLYLIYSFSGSYQDLTVVYDLITNLSALKIDSIWKMLLIISIILTITFDIIILICSIIKNIIMFFQNLKCRKILKEKYDLTDESLYELPKYEPIVANAIYKKNYQYEMIVARFEYYYKIKGIVDKNDKLNERIDFDMNSLTEIEKMIMNKYQKNTDGTKKLTSEELMNENQKNRNEFRNKINEILKEKKYYKENNRKIKLKRISLTLEGEIERAKIIFLINYLKKKKILSEEENYFLIMLTKY